MTNEQVATPTVLVISISRAAGSAVLGVVPDTADGRRLAWGGAQLHAERAYGLKRDGWAPAGADDDRRQVKLHPEGARLILERFPVWP